MTTIQLPLISKPIKVTLPDIWQVQTLGVGYASALNDAGIAAALERPIVAAPLADIVRGKTRIMIVVDDCMRPTPVHRIAPLLVRQLAAAGVADSQIRFMLATGMHRAQTGRDLVAKLGREIVQRFEILSHNPYENLVFAGTSPRGIPVWVNRWVAEADVRIGISGILPHNGAGFGGGAKVIMPGVCGIETVAAHHEGVPRGTRDLERNEWRGEIETIARLIGLDWCVNVVINGCVEPAGVFAGDMVAAHRQAVALATRLYETTLPVNLDIALVSGYPMDQELAQARKAVRTVIPCVRPGGSIVLFGDCPEGAGFHALYGPGGRFHEMAKGGITRQLGDRQVWVCSPGVGPFETHQYLPDTTLVIPDSEELVARLAARHPRARVCAFRQGMLLIGK